MYTFDLLHNLYEPLQPDVRESFLRADGSELNGDPSKMQALHSSSALGVNVFQYWHRINEVSAIAAACGFCKEGSTTPQKIVFEDKYPIDSRFRFAPNIDIVFHNTDSSQVKRFAVECKFSEAYGSQGHDGLKEQYLNLSDIWNDLPNTHGLAKRLRSAEKGPTAPDPWFTYLHAAQLIKHILGLKTKFGKDGFRLLYLWYDVPGEEGQSHRKEIETFSDIVQEDSVKFHSITYQELIIKLADRHRLNHSGYVEYLTARYL